MKRHLEDLEDYDQDLLIKKKRELLSDEVNKNKHIISINNSWVLINYSYRPIKNYNNLICIYTSFNRNKFGKKKKKSVK